MKILEQTINWYIFIQYLLRFICLFQLLFLILHQILKKDCMTQNVDILHHTTLLLQYEAGGEKVCN